MDKELKEILNWDYNYRFIWYENIPFWLAVAVIFIQIIGSKYGWNKDKQYKIKLKNKKIREFKTKEIKKSH